MADDDALPFGIEASTGQPLNALTDDIIEELLGGKKKEEPKLDVALRARVQAAKEAEDEATSFAIAEDGSDFNAASLADVGWAVLFGETVDQKIKDALVPLIAHREKEAGKRFKVLDHLPGEDAHAWLKRNKVSLQPVDRDGGVPYYLLIVASPDDIGFEFQYTVDLQWGCGRLWFDTPDAFRRYAESVVKYETDAAVPTSRQIALFAPEHDFDKSTQLFTRQVAHPMCGRLTTSPALGSGRDYRLREFLGAAATKEGLGDILRGKIKGGRPALLFSGGHGMQFINGDARQLDMQGALVCQDWGGYGEIQAKHWFAGSDVPADAQVHGMIHFMFACHGGGVPKLDDFDRINNAPKEIAPRAFFSKLPQALLSHANGGALAVFAHLERAWAYGFQGDGGFGQIQGFRDVLSKLTRGDRIGFATDTFNFNWATTATRLSDEQLARTRDETRPIAPIRKLWIQRDDARNFMVFGDPAVRLRQQDMAPLIS